MQDCEGNPPKNRDGPRTSLVDSLGHLLVQTELPDSHFSQTFQAELGRKRPARNRYSSEFPRRKVSSHIQAILIRY